MPGASAHGSQIQLASCNTTCATPGRPSGSISMAAPANTSRPSPTT
eukprot:CAMPEP_0183454508 /NCGR_PEP_ID=MMETSP0370-20130417/124239_1 /TAXON_ID=268820 /ORGANISM="Peridinium aciculiferum, Strain PAER-2" /LENGTH=45 /DNA_ID= /DNA_START= /DNA_END= /DNA_ORIENTATION=